MTSGAHLTSRQVTKILTSLLHGLQDCCLKWPCWSQSSAVVPLIGRSCSFSGVGMHEVSTRRCSCTLPHLITSPADSIQYRDGKSYSRAGKKASSFLMYWRHRPQVLPVATRKSARRDSPPRLLLIQNSIPLPAHFRTCSMPHCSAAPLNSPNYARHGDVETGTLDHNCCRDQAKRLCSCERFISATSRTQTLPPRHYPNLKCINFFAHAARWLFDAMLPETNAYPC